MPQLSRALRTSLTALTAAALTLTGTAGATAFGPSGALNAGNLPIADHVAITPTGSDFTIYAAPGKNVTVDAHSRISDRGEAFTKRIKLNGSGAEAARSLHFAVAESEVPTEVFVAARSGSATADRAVALYTATGEVGRAPALADVDSLAVTTERIAITSPGEYWLASPSSGVNVYFAQLGAFEPQARAAWGDVATPVVTSVEPDPVNPANLLVAYEGLLGTDGGDVVYASLLAANGAVVDQTLAATDGTAGTLSLTPPASGAYEVEVRLTRAGETSALISARAAVGDFSLPLVGPTVTGALTSGIVGGSATVTLSWSATAEADSYSVEASSGGAPFTALAQGVTGTTADVPGFTPGASHQVRIVAHRGAESATGAESTVDVAAGVERWQIADIGSNAGSGGSVLEHDDGSITFDAKASSTKLANSEDGFQYFYTQVDPATENFTLTATFRVDDATAKDAQSGFGVLAVDDLVPGVSAARYFNSAGALLTRYPFGTGAGEWQDGTPGARFVHGYTGATTDNTAGTRDMGDSEAFDWEYRPDAVGPKFAAGDEYELTLRKSNTGYHAIWHRDGQDLEVIHYDPDMLDVQNADASFVGLAVARKIQVTVTDWEFTTILPADDEPRQDPPTEYVPATLSVDVTRTTPESSLDVPLVANMYGTGRILDASGEVVAGDVPLAPGERVLVPVELEPGVNELTARFLPAAEQPHLGEDEQVESTDPVDVPLTVTVDSFGEPGQSIRVAPDGTADGDGTTASPLDLPTAVAFAQAGQQIVLEGGTYALPRRVVAERGRDGTAEAPITLMSEPGARAVLDLSGSPDGGLVLRGDWWHVYDLEITGSADKKKPMLIQGHHNVVERVESHHNMDTGIQISGSEAEPPALWPTDNLVVSSVSHDNADLGGNDADGFAAKLSVGEGNVFRSNIAYNNIDDGWDLYAKSTTGPIGTVIVEDSVAYDNGWLQADPSRIGEGNGFKLGGESMPGDHLLRNSVSFGNLATGVTSNSGPDIRLDRVTSVGNDRGVRLETNAAATDYRAAGVLSWQSPQTDVLALKQADTSLLADPTNVWNTGAASPVTADWFESVDLDGPRPEIAADGSIDLHGLLELTDAAPAASGARIEPIAEPTEIAVLPEVTVPLANLTAPSIAGNPVKGATLTADPGTWSHGDAAIAYQWLSDGEPIPGRKGTEATYKVRGGDVAHDLSVAVTATVDGQGPVTATAPAVTIVDDRPGPAQVIAQLVQTLLDWLRRLFG
ncbi:right-handed parallel beta-helix repeat-containing protein [Agromyces sp. PvR057]|uniref:right-handed parallel beta-helix repeat-containing protein n=1 Tax=Agromyces sp. PvR057 TaxID=3156403 RepID=UPI0033981C63